MTRKSSDRVNNSNTSSPSPSSCSPNRRRRVLFKVRDSPFTKAIRNPSLRATFSLFVATQVLFLIATCTYYFYDHEMFFGDVNFFIRMLSPIHVSLLLELVCTLTIFTLVPVVRMQKSVVQTIIKFMVVTLVFLVVLIFPIGLRIKFDVHPILACAMGMQQLRFLMKIISFVAENPPPVPIDRHDPERNNNEEVIEEKCCKIEVPTVKSLLYFLFAPTLIYQHRYPASDRPRSLFKIISYLCQWIFLFFPAVVLINNIYLPMWAKIGRESLTPEYLYSLFLWSIPGSMLVWFGIGYCFLHCWLNMWAEMLNFGDRMFYRNWWASSNGLHAWSLWNYMIHLWIARYIYIPVIKLTRSRPFALLYTFILSAFFHDYVISFAAGFFFPFLVIVVVCLVAPSTPLFLAIGFVAQYVPLTKTNVHVFFTAILSITVGMIYAAFEYQTREKCDTSEGNMIWKMIVPRTPSCLGWI